MDDLVIFENTLKHSNDEMSESGDTSQMPDSASKKSKGSAICSASEGPSPKKSRVSRSIVGQSEASPDRTTAGDDVDVHCAGCGRSRFEGFRGHQQQSI